MISEKIGADEDMDTVFKGRKPSGRLEDQSEEDRSKNLIMGRIMRIKGLEEGRNSGGNVDSFGRYIYIHGTNQEAMIGKPNSHGCVLVGAADLGELFGSVPEQTIVFIEI